MPFDIALSENGDLVFSAIRDLQGVAGVNEVNQRIRTRLKIPRGTWAYDDDGTLGSQLYTLGNANPLEIQTRAEAYVREALRGMDDVVIDHVELDTASGVLTVNVFYHLVGEGDYTADDLATLQLTIPLGG